MKQIVFFTEEESMCVFLRGILPRIAPGLTEKKHYFLNDLKGNTNLFKKLPSLIRAWSSPDYIYMVLTDRDSYDCVGLKNSISHNFRYCTQKYSVRIVCQELEAWYFGDVSSLYSIYGKQRIRRLFPEISGEFVPDEIDKPGKIIKRRLCTGKVECARKVAERINIGNNSSHSFNVFIKKLKEFISEVMADGEEQ